MSPSRKTEPRRLVAAVLGAVAVASLAMACREASREGSEAERAPLGPAEASKNERADDAQATGGDVAKTAPAVVANDASDSKTVLAASVKSACPDGMALVPGGDLRSLERGDATRVADFCLDVHEVTVAELKKTTPLSSRTEWGSVDDDWIASKYCNARFSDRDGHPANCVSIDEARAHCASRGARLPGGDEWEWAARGGSSMSTPWGGPVATDEICWGRPHKRGGTCPSGDHPKDKTAAGIVDLGGNVSEWTEPPARLQAAKGARFAHGASWYAIDDGYARAALGGFETPAARAETIGFRCAAEPKR
jgi:formylglycine-generating enzyme required for sulfatase activity